MLVSRVSLFYPWKSGYKAMLPKGKLGRHKFEHENQHRLSPEKLSFKAVSCAGHTRGKETAKEFVVGSESNMGWAVRVTWVEE